MEAFKKAYVYVRNTFAGVLSETDSGYMFSYDDDYLISENASAVSLTLRHSPFWCAPTTARLLWRR